MQDNGTRELANLSAAADREATLTCEEETGFIRHASEMPMRDATTQSAWSI